MCHIYYPLHESKGYKVEMSHELTDAKFRVAEVALSSQGIYTSICFLSLLYYMYDCDINKKIYMYFNIEACKNPITAITSFLTYSERKVIRTPL